MIAAIQAKARRDVGADRARRNQEVGLWRTLGYELDSWAHGTATVNWQASAEYGFATNSGYVIQGGLVTALLDAAMGSCCWSVLDYEHIFLTTDLRVEFLRPTRPGRLTATGTVVRASRSAVFCSAELQDVEGTLVAASRCTQLVLPIAHAGGRSPDSGPMALPD